MKQINLLFPSGTFRRYDKGTPELLLDCIACLIGHGSLDRKKAANLMLKIILTRKAYKDVMELLESEIDVIDRSDPRVHKWKLNVLKKGHCERCGSTKNLEAHHMIHWSESPLDRINPDNGICLCHKCHTREHEGETVYFLMSSKI